MCSKFNNEPKYIPIEASCAIHHNLFAVTSYTSTLPANLPSSLSSLHPRAAAHSPQDECEAYARCQTQSSNRGDDWHQQALGRLRT